MKTLDAIEAFDKLESKLRRVVFSKRDLRVVFPDENERSLNRSLERLTEQGVLERPVKGVYVYARGKSRANYLLEEVARVMRQAEMNYLSLESALSEQGLISQIPVSAITVMTTGRAGTYKTPYGMIEFTHTKRDEADILERCVKQGDRPLPVAKPEYALADLKRVGRNLNMVEEMTRQMRPGM